MLPWIKFGTFFSLVIKAGQTRKDPAKFSRIFRKDPENEGNSGRMSRLEKQLKS